MISSTGPARTRPSDGRVVRRQRQVRELLGRRGHLLTGADRALIAMYLEGGETIRRIATLAAVTPSCVARRIQTIMQRLADPTYPACLAQRHDFSALELRIIKDYFVRGLSIRTIRLRRKRGTHYIRRIIRKARTYASAPAAAARADRQKG